MSKLEKILADIDSEKRATIKSCEKVSKHLKNNWAKVKTPSLIVEEKGKQLFDELTFFSSNRGSHMLRSELHTIQINAQMEYLKNLEDQVTELKRLIKAVSNKKSVCIKTLKMFKKGEKTIAHSLGMKRKEFLEYLKTSPNELDP